MRETRTQLIDFYRDIVQDVKAWQARAPKLPEAPLDVPETPSQGPHAFGDAGAREIGEAWLPDEPALHPGGSEPTLDGRRPAESG